MASGALLLQIKDEAFVEDINNLLNSGEVPNMFPSDEKMQVSLGLGAYAAHAPSHLRHACWCSQKAASPEPGALAGSPHGV